MITVCKAWRPEIALVNLQETFRQSLGLRGTEELSELQKKIYAFIKSRGKATRKEVMESLRQVLCIAFDADESFGTTNYHEARAKLGLPDDGVPIPEVFIEAFAGT